MILQAEVTRPTDAAVLWAETYASDSTTAAILRTGDRVLSRKERVEELERKIAERPYFGHQVYAGLTMISYDGPLGDYSGLAGGYRLYEHFGRERRFLFAIGAEVFAAFIRNNELIGAFLGVTFQYDLLPRELDLFTLRVGGTVSAFFGGSEGRVTSACRITRLSSM